MTPEAAARMRVQLHEAPLGVIPPSEVQWRADLQERGWTGRQPGKAWLAVELRGGKNQIVIEMGG